MVHKPILTLDSTTRHNMYPATVYENNDDLYIHMDDHDAYHGWKFTVLAEEQLYEILGQRASARGKKLLGME